MGITFTSVGSRNESDEPGAWTEPRQDRSYTQYNKQPMTVKPRRQTESYPLENV